MAHIVVLSRFFATVSLCKAATRREGTAAVVRASVGADGTAKVIRENMPTAGDTSFAGTAGAYAGTARRETFDWMHGTVNNPQGFELSAEVDSDRGRSARRESGAHGVEHVDVAGVTRRPEIFDEGLELGLGRRPTVIQRQSDARGIIEQLAQKPNDTNDGGEVARRDPSAVIESRADSLAQSLADPPRGAQQDTSSAEADILNVRPALIQTLQFPSTTLSGYAPIYIELGVGVPLIFAVIWLIYFTHVHSRDAGSVPSQSNSVETHDAGTVSPSASVTASVEQFPRLEIKDGAKIAPISAAHLRHILEKEEAGIDLSKWGTEAAKSVDELYEELLNGSCELKWIADGCGELHIQRRVRTVLVRLSANTRKGLRYLKSFSLVDHRHDRKQEFKNKDPARKIGKSDDADEQIQALLWKELRLNVAWQNEHLKEEGKGLQHFYNNENFGTSLPGMATLFTCEVTRMTVKDVEDEGVTGKLGLPEGDDFETVEETFLASKSHHWKWVPPDSGPGVNQMESRMALPAAHDESDGDSKHSSFGASSSDQ
jgi:hypothetical protein